LNGVHLETRCTGRLTEAARQADPDLLEGSLDEAGLMGQRRDGRAVWLGQVQTGSGRPAPVAERRMSWRGPSAAPGNRMRRIPRTVVQATPTPKATTPLNWWDFRQYLEDYISAMVGIWTILKGRGLLEILRRSAPSVTGCAGIMGGYTPFRPLSRHISLSTRSA